MASLLVAPIPFLGIVALLAELQAARPTVEFRCTCGARATTPRVGARRTRAPSLRGLLSSARVTMDCDEWCKLDHNVRNHGSRRLTGKDPIILDAQSDANHR